MKGGELVHSKQKSSLGAQRMVSEFLELAELQESPEVVDMLKSHLNQLDSLENVNLSQVLEECRARCPEAMHAEQLMMADAKRFCNS